MAPMTRKTIPTRFGLPLLAVSSIAFLFPPGCGKNCRDKPNVILITLDTTRADHLGAYGYGGDTSPNLDALAEQSLVFSRARSTSSWTLPAHASLFTGQFPHQHGVRYDTEGTISLEDAISEGSRTHLYQPYRVRGIDPETPTLAELMRLRRYRTGAVVAGPWLMRPFGLDRGFEHYDEGGITSYAGRRADEVTDAAVDWLGTTEFEEHERFFLFLNYFDPHVPYEPPGASTDPEDPVAAYDDEIRFMDRQLGRLFDELEAQGLFDSTLIVVTGDHGELLGERDRWGHGRYLDEVLIRVPLLLKMPGNGERGRSGVPVQLPDLHRLLLRIVDGHDDDPEAEAQALLEAREVRSVAEVWPSPDTPEIGRVVTIIEGRFKLLYSDLLDRAELYDLDVSETKDVSESRPELYQRLLSFAKDLPTASGPSIPVDEETRERLESLGYGGN